MALAKSMSGNASAPAPAPAAKAARQAVSRDRLIGAISVLIFLTFWEITYRLNWVDPLFVSSPIRIVLAAINMFKTGTIWKDIYVSGLEFAIGYGAAVLVGIPIGIGIGWYRTFNAVMDPFVSALYATPRVALLPLIIIWTGIGIWSKVAVIFLGAVFQVLVSTATGVRTLDAHLIKAARSFGASDAQIFRTIALPGSVPHILTGLRLAVGRGLIGVVVGELYAATAGVGYLIAVAGASFQTDKVFVGVIIIAVAGIVMVNWLKRLEARFDKWRPQRPE